MVTPTNVRTVRKIYPVEITDNRSLNIKLKQLSSEEKNIYDMLLEAPYAMSTAEVMNYHILGLATIESLNKYPKNMSMEERKKRHYELSQRSQEHHRITLKDKGVSVPSFYTFQELLENLEDFGLVLKREQEEKKKKNLWSIHPDVLVAKGKV